MILKPAHTCSKAFTLVELLLGAAITAIIGVSVYNVFWSGVKLDDNMRRAHDNYMEVLMADQSMRRDLENIVSLDLSLNYPNLKMFEGAQNSFTFLTATPAGIKRVRYYSGLVEWGKTTKVIIGQKVSRLSDYTITRGGPPIEFLLREELSVSDWANRTNAKPVVQIIAAGLAKGSFACRYAPRVKDINIRGSKSIVFKEAWKEPEMPMAVSCSFALFDDRNPRRDLTFKYDIFLPEFKNDGQS